MSLIFIGVSQPHASNLKKRARIEARGGGGLEPLTGRLTCPYGAPDNKGRSRATIAPTKGDQMHLAVGHFRARLLVRIKRSYAETVRDLIVRVSE